MIDYPRRSPHFLACRRAVRAQLSYLQGHARIVVGLSGGPDSLALVSAALVEGAEVEAVIIDHQLQQNSAQVAQRARRQAEEWGAHATVVEVEVGVGSVEAAARRARYEALEAVAQGRELWLAHTADDQAETMLLGIMRGQAAGMLARHEGKVRPFLGLRRATTVGACEELGVEYWSDPHNEDLRFRRVAVRKQVIPLLEEIMGGEAVNAVAAAADKTGEDHRLLLEMTPVTTDCAELAALPWPLRRRALGQVLRMAGLRVTDVAVQEVSRLCTHWRGQGPVPVGGGEVRRVEGKLLVQPAIDNIGTNLS